MLKRIHWFGPTSMLLALFAGISFSVGHHLFYDGLYGEEIPPGNYTVGERNSGISKQQANVAIGTALAFAVKTCLVLAVSTAYVQLFWKALNVETSNKTFTLQSVDTAYSALRNAILLFNFTGWRRFPLLFVLALATWLIPIASIITPATLSIESQLMPSPPVAIRNVPSISFNSLSYVGALRAYHSTGPGGSSSYHYAGPSQFLKRIAIAVGAQGTILPIDPPSANATWVWDFDGPAIRCERVPVAQRHRIQRNIAEYLSQGDVSCNNAAGYLSWYGDLPYAANPVLHENGTVSSQDTKFALSPSRQLFSDTGTTFRIAVMPNLLSIDTTSATLEKAACWVVSSSRAESPSGPLGSLASSSEILECQLVNSTYHAKFDYVNGNQTVRVDVPQTPDEKSCEAVDEFAAVFTEDCMGLLEDHVLHTDMSHEHELAGDCMLDRALSQRLAYQSILDAFFGVISGPVGERDRIDGNVVATTLLETKELSYLTDWALATQHQHVHGTLQNKMIEAGQANASGIVMPVAEEMRPPLSQVLEQMFQNVTVSLMSSKTFQPNVTNLAELPQTEVTSQAYHNVYVYTAQRLWIAYGVAILCATIAVGLGLFAIITTGSSYSSDFSTILRVSRHAHLSHEVDKCDASGRDPLPKYLAKARLNLPASREDEEVSIETEQKTTTSTTTQLLPSSENRALDVGQAHASTW